MGARWAPVDDQSGTVECGCSSEDSKESVKTAAAGRKETKAAGRERGGRERRERQQRRRQQEERRGREIPSHTTQQLMIVCGNRNYTDNNVDVRKTGRGD